MVNRKQVYVNIALFSMIIAIIIALFSDARNDMVLNDSHMGYLSSITFILLVFQALIIVYNEVNELRALSFRFFISFKVIIYINIRIRVQEQLSAIYRRIVSHINLQVIRC
jgi:hypothetical protein